MGVVVDTNVPVVASGHFPDAEAKCIAACTLRLAQIMSEGGLFIDDKGHILLEYLKSLGYAGQPGAGEAFAKWVHDHQADPERITKVVITPITNHTRRKYLEFPASASLSKFDLSDQKYVAVALSSNKQPTIVNAVDSDWWNFQKELEAEGVVLEFLCPEQQKIKKARKPPAKK